MPGPDTPAYEFEQVQWAGPSAVMLQALRLVQQDLDTVGLERIRLSFAVAGGSDEYPIVNVQWRGTWTSDSIDLDATDLAGVTADVAAQMAQGLIELEGIYMPTCPDHNNWASAGVSIGGSAVWACNKQGVTPHVLAAVGELDLIRTPRHRIAPLWRNLAELGPP